MQLPKFYYNILLSYIINKGEIKNKKYCLHCNTLYLHTHTRFYKLQPLTYTQPKRRKHSIRFYSQQNILHFNRLLNQLSRLRMGASKSLAWWNFESAIEQSSLPLTHTHTQTSQSSPGLLVPASPACVSV